MLNTNISPQVDPLFLESPTPCLKKLSLIFTAREFLL